MNKRTNENEKLVLQLVSNYKGEFIDCCYAICKWCEEREYSCEEQAQCLQVLCEAYGSVENSETEILQSYISEDEKEKLKEAYGEYINAVIRATLNKAYNNENTSEEFYKMLWLGICNSELITSLAERSFAMYYIAIDKRVPYFCLKQGLLMSNKEYENYINENEQTIRKIRFILSLDFSQKTEEASLIVDEILNAKSYNEQAVIMTTILNTMRRESKKLREIIRKLKGETS